MLLSPIAMAVRNKIYQSEYPYHIYNRANNKEFLFNLEESFPIFMDTLKWVSDRTDFRPHHFILMSNHYHLIASTPRSNLGEIMQMFQRIVSQSLNRENGRINHIFGGRYGATVIISEEYQFQVIRYLYQNPCRAGLVRYPTEYKYSTLNYYLKGSAVQDSFTWDSCFEGINKAERPKFLYELSTLYLEEKAISRLQCRLKKRLIV